MRVVLSSLVLLLPCSAFAGDPPRPVDPATVVGKFAFEWTRGKAKCKKVDAATVKKWTCMPPDPDVGTASGKPLFATCKLKKQEHLVFATMAECKEEQETQAANGE